MPTDRRLLRIVTLAAALVIGVGTLSAMAAGRAATNADPNKPKAAPYCWTSKHPVLVQTRKGSHWETRRVRACR
jgi:hypothetical protein